MKLLITIAPLLYRESIALTIQSSRPDFEVMYTSARTLNENAEDFRPNLLIRDDSRDDVFANEQNVLCVIEILYSDSMGARIRFGGEVWVIEDISSANLLEIADRVQKSVLASEK